MVTKLQVLSKWWRLEYYKFSPSGTDWITGCLPVVETGSQVLAKWERLGHTFSASGEDWNTSSLPVVKTGSHVLRQWWRLDHRFSPSGGDCFTGCPPGPAYTSQSACSMLAQHANLVCSPPES